MVAVCSFCLFAQIPRKDSTTSVASFPVSTPQLFFAHSKKLGSRDGNEATLVTYIEVYSIPLQASYPGLPSRLFLQPWKTLFSTAAKKAVREGLGTRLSLSSSPGGEGWIMYTHTHTLSLSLSGAR